MIKVATIAGHSYYPGVAVTLVSLVRAASHPEEIEFHILTDDLCEEDCQRLTELGRKYGMMCEVVVHHPNLEEIRATCPDYKNSPLTWLSLYLPSYFPKDDWIVYCDADVLWGKDVCALWTMRRDSVGVFWCRDLRQTQLAVAADHLRWNPRFCVDKYCCNAVALVNLKMLRKMDFLGRVKQFFAQNGCPYYCDQDIENHLMNDSSEVLERTWNCMTPTRRAQTGANIHCLGIARQFVFGHMMGWNARNAIWFDFYNAYVASNSEKMVSASWSKRGWFFVLGLTYPLCWFYRLMTFSMSRQRYEQLVNLHFFAWIWVRRRQILNMVYFFQKEDMNCG